MEEKVNPVEAISKLGHRMDIYETKDKVLADEDHNGAISAKKYQEILGAIGQREYVDAGTDIEQLPMGHYWSTGFKNSIVPADQGALSFVDITGASKDQREIRVVTSYNGHVYYKTHHSNNAGINASAPSGFGLIEKYYTLWQGGQSTINSYMTVADSLGKYAKLRFTTQTSNGNEDILYATVAPKFSLHSFNVYDHPKEAGISVFEISFEVEGNNLRIIDNRKIEIITGSVSDSTASDRLVIKKIEGAV